MPQGKGTYGSQVGRPKKNLHTDPPRGGRSIPKVTPKKKTGLSKAQSQLLGQAQKYAKKTGQNTKQIQSATAKYGNRMKPTGSTTAKRKKPDQRATPTPKPKGPNHPTSKKLGSLLSQQSKKAGGRVASPVKRATGGGQPVRRAKAPVRGRRSAPTRGGRR